MAGLSLRFLAFFCFLHYSAAVEYKLCATPEHEFSCKFIKAAQDEVSCVRVSDSIDCLLKMQKNEADFGTFYPEEAFLAARFLGNSALVLAEIRNPDREDAAFSFQTVAVVRKTLFGGLSGLRNMSYCHPGFSRAQYWSDRVLKSFESKVLKHFEDDVKCNLAMRSIYEDELYRLSRIFSKACRPGMWAVSDWWDKKLKGEYHSLCDQCEHPSTCSYEVRNKGRHSDALRCLTQQGGNVTYTALEFVREYFELDSEKSFLVPEHKNPMRYNFLCPDGSTEPLDTPNPCSWIKQPWTSVIALSSTGPGLKKNLTEWLEVNKNRPWMNHLRTILTKEKGVVKFPDDLISVVDYIKKGRDIPTEDSDSCRRAIRWCVINKTEKKKCEYIAAAALTHGLPIQLRCIESSSKIDCLRKIRDRETDITYIDAELGFVSRKVYNLTAGAYLETQRAGNYYGVAVIKGNAVRKFRDLQGKSACFPQYNGLGWLTFISALKSLSVIPSRSCVTSKKIWNYFSQTCAPGARDPALTTHSQKVPDRLCKSCTNANEGSSCEATPNNPYFGEIGALKCLNNGDGDVAFLDFYTIQKYLSSSTNRGDFKILCKDGSIETFNMTNPEKCSFTQLNGGEIVTREDLEPVEKNNIHHTLLELDDLFGTTSRSYNPAMRMFEPFDGTPNLLFKETAVSLVSVYETQNSFINNYVTLMSSSEECGEGSDSSTLLPSLFCILFSIFIIFNQF